jgi:hypothetical protein
MRHRAEAVELGSRTGQEGQRQDRVRARAELRMKVMTEMRMEMRMETEMRAEMRIMEEDIPSIYLVEINE